MQNDPVNFVDPTGLVTYDGAADPHLIAEGLVGGLLWAIQHGGLVVTHHRIVMDRTAFNYWSFWFLTQDTGQPFLTRALNEATRRLQEDTDCAKLFGGLQNALKKLAELNFKFGSLDNEGIADLNGKDVTLDSGRFGAQGANLPFATNIRESTVQGHPSTSFTLKTLTVTGSTFGAFILLHELGHRSKIFGKYDKDGGSKYNNLPNAANNEKIRTACFGELEPN